MGEKVIKEGNQVLLKRGNVYKAVEIRKHRKVAFERLHFFLDEAIGCSLGSSFEVKDGKLVKVDNVEIEPLAACTSTEKEVAESGRDNRNIKDDGSSQKLSKDDIMALKADGVSGEAIIEHLIENSTTFNERTEFSKAKYIKRKKNKHVSKITIVEPTTRLICEMYYAKGPGKICDLRIDTVAQILCMSNVHANSKVLIMENCQGVLLGAVMERMGGFGKIVQIYSGDFPTRLALECFNFSKEERKILTGYPLNKITLLDSLDTEGECNADICMETVEPQDESLPEQSVDEDEKDKKREARKAKRLFEMKSSKEILQSRNMDSLIIASKMYPQPILMALLPYLAPSRPFVVYCPYKEPLMDCYLSLRDLNKVVHIKLSETWWRNYQVLEGRTHPEITMNATGGYLLTGITVS